MFERIPNELKVKNQWVNITASSKLPISPIDGYAASSSNPCTWGDFETARDLVINGYFNNLGFVFDSDYVAIDLDSNVFDKWGLLTPFAVEIINKFRSYTEKSRSGRGIHIIVKGSLPFKGRNNHNGVEIYNSGRYFIMTGNVLVHDTIISNQEAIDWFVDKFFSDILLKSDNQKYLPKIYQPEWVEPYNNGKFKTRPTYPPVCSGSRNIAMTSLAGTLHSIGYNKAQILSEILIANKTACVPPLHDTELRTIVNSITRYSR